ncbi:MAG TPA: hypothetical protein VE715_14775 [Blastocatellia bacterium]|nr:hypothetical protein [Blastocatellia bacterium]
MTEQNVPIADKDVNNFGSAKKSLQDKAEVRLSYAIAAVSQKPASLQDKKYA